MTFFKISLPPSNVSTINSSACLFAYTTDYPQILYLRSEPQFNLLFAHLLAFGREYKLLDTKDTKGAPNASVGIGLVWDRRKEMGILEG
jgi:MOB kinase activator 1